MDHRKSSHQAMNRSIKATRGRYLILACTDNRHQADALERIIALLEARPDVALIYANSYITVTENQTFEHHTRVGSIAGLTLTC